MDTYTPHPSTSPASAFPQLRWDSAQLADAVPHRLHEIDLLAGIDGTRHHPRTLRQATRRYAPPPLAASAFRIHG